ncbi:Aste57867_20184 [Aphanomyces stellatus]|uniref:Aste57867_20184 protein n=1 Tax=Aphanomyces stellatus TaxID=120398 RepID=A0A485LEZ9_9STRA|nr:hypothetical protein As57867_020118 [Aphanomyces stellatus]VFT96878.1 Aste57867_20184 [Aphanomyces stellatus]
MQLSVVLLGLVGAATAVSAQSTPWRFQQVRTIQARVQNSPPKWSDSMKRWVGSFAGADPYVGPMDSTTMATVEGSLLYLQSKLQLNGTNCTRYNNMSYIWFYDIQVVQPAAAIAAFGATTGQILEYGQYVDMESGSCDLSINHGGNPPDECLDMARKTNNSLGNYVGAQIQRVADYGAYNDTVWFSYPNSCVFLPYAKKTDACRAEQPGGLCPLGVKPDGINCTFGYTILGHLRIDDLVGITNMTFLNDSTRTYANRAEFCYDGRKEYVLQSPTTYSDVDFWQDGLNRTMNVQRSLKLIDFYRNNMGPNMLPLPMIPDLTASNPPCYVNSQRCYKAPFGCRRNLLGQVCELCSSAGDPTCVVRPPNVTLVFPTTADGAADITLPPVTAAPPTVAPISNGLSAGSIVGIVFGGILLIGLLVIFGRRRRQHESSDRFTTLAADSTKGGGDPNSAYRSMDTSADNTTLSFDMQDLALIRLEESSLTFVKVLGSGTFADVWLGTFETQQVAIKKMHPNKVNLRHIQSFVEEIKLMSGFDSPYIVKCLGACWTRPSDLTCVMEYMDSSDLRTMLEQSTPETLGWEPTKYNYLHNMVAGLTYLHSYNVIHRDLKSRNLLVDSTKGLKVTDFGISREDLQATMTVGVGTFRWMAPEVIQGHYYHVAADIYSLGMIISELDTHLIPYHNMKNPASGQTMTDTAIILAVGQGSIKPEFTPACPDWVKDLALRCISFNADDRPTANEITQLIRDKLREIRA